MKESLMYEPNNRLLAGEGWSWHFLKEANNLITIFEFLDPDVNPFGDVFWVEGHWCGHVDGSPESDYHSNLQECTAWLEEQALIYRNTIPPKSEINQWIASHKKVDLII